MRFFFFLEWYKQKEKKFDETALWKDVGRQKEGKRQTNGQRDTEKRTEKSYFDLKRTRIYGQTKYIEA